MKKFTKVTSLILSIACSVIFSFLIYGNLSFPDIIRNENIYNNKSMFFTVINSDQSTPAFSYNDSKSSVRKSSVNFLGVIPVKNVTVSTSEAQYLIPGGDLIGINLKTDGVLIVGTENFETANGTKNPAAEAGLQIGDTLVSVDDIKINTNSQLAEIIASSQGKALEIKLKRDGNIIETVLKPEKSSVSGLYKGGLWIRDSTGGIGTLTFIDIENSEIGALGHGIYDIDTTLLIPSESGEFYRAELTGIIKGENGCAGELRGSFCGSAFGDIEINCDNGIYGVLERNPFDTEPLPVAHADEITTGKAQIISTIYNNEKQYFDIEIEKINKNSDNKNMIIEITDEDMLSVTGGIVQGMSGSPIIQNGKIIGAVTHVFLNDPTRGYGILIENMLNVN